MLPTSNNSNSDGAEVYFVSSISLDSVFSCQSITWETPCCVTSSLPLALQHCLCYLLANRSYHHCVSVPQCLIIERGREGHSVTCEINYNLAMGIYSVVG